MRTTRAQFLRTPWEHWKQNPQNAKLLSRLVDRHGKTDQLDHLSSDDFINLLEEDDLQMLENSLATAQRREIDAHIPVYYWLADDSAAIFAILSLSEKAVEHGFTTTDQQLITALNEMREHYHRLSESQSDQASPAPS
jgi:hypothetical protein